LIVLLLQLQLPPLTTGMLFCDKNLLLTFSIMTYLLGYAPSFGGRSLKHGAQRAISSFSSPILRRNHRSIQRFRAPASNDGLYYNRETWKKTADNSSRSFSSDSTKPIVKHARILSLADPRDPANDPLHQGDLGECATLLQVGTCWDDFDIPRLQQDATSPNVLFVSHPQAREPLAQLLQALPSVEWIHTRSAGIDFITSPTLERWNGIVTNAKGQFSSTLAEYTLMACAYL
jgi:hypothetical protein